MRSLIIAAAALIAVAAPGVASADTSGVVGLAFANLEESNDPAKEGAWAVDVELVHVPGNGWTLRGRASSIDMDHSDHSDGFSNVEIGASYEVAPNLFVGGQVGQFNYVGSMYWQYGAAVRYNFNRFSVGAGVSGSDNVNGNSEDVSNVTVRGGMALTEALHAELTASWTDAGFTEADSYGVGIAYYIPGTHLSIGALYRRTEFDSDDTDAFAIRFAKRFGDDNRGGVLTGFDQAVYDAVAIQ